MISPKLLLSLMVLAGTQSAPQISERQVVGDVLAQLQPAITRAINSIGGGGSRGSSSFSGGNRGGGSSSFSGGSRGFGSSSFSAPARSSSSRFSPSSSSSSSSVSSVTGSVVSSLQPAIARAVAQALGARGGSIGARGPTGGTQEPEYGPAQYDFSYKVADDDAQAYIAQEESRQGDDVTGSYNYVDATGSLVTVNYQAGVDGYSQTRDVQRGAVDMRNLRGPWNIDTSGPVQPAAPVRQTRPSGLSQSDLIAQILSSIQPQISSAVQGAISSNSRARAPRPAPRRPRPQPVPAPARSIPVGGDLVGLFGVPGEGAHVRLQTPEISIQY